MIVLMLNCYHILIQHIHLLVNDSWNKNKTKRLFLLLFILEKARQNNGRVFIHCLGLYFTFI